MRAALLFASIAALLSACGQASSKSGRISGVNGNEPTRDSSSVPAGAPVETKPANAPDQRPAFAGQTRAPAPAKATAVEVATVAKGLEGAWALEFLPGGKMLVTEKAGRMRLVGPDGSLSPPVAGVPKVDARDQGGLLDVALSPSFAADRLIYWSYSEPRGDEGNGTTVARAKLVEGPGGGARLEGVQIIFRQAPTWDSSKHFGSRLVFAPDGKLFVTLGERSLPKPREHAQRLDGLLGKIVRINPDGSVPADNPFVERPGVRPEIWSYGHRNIQSAALDGQGRLWEVEHGPRGGDELNRPEPGKNYGWPVITYGIDYDGDPIGQGMTQREGLEQPVYYWDPVIAPSGMAYYDAALFPAWRGSFLVGGLVSMGLVVVKMEGDRVANEERIDLGFRTRDVKVGADGAVYVVTDRGDGRILRLTPRG
ncbi:MAG TPA: PQQ-dependent sugar dehydrogenase [Polyangiaceae bacterium]|nr:PQQ-dependent sugar dehydrogenase [Polyangiaceae bacterium]